MIAQELRAALHATPFRPFAICMADGRSFEIIQPDLLLLAPHGRTAFAFEPSGDAFSILDVGWMIEIEFGRQGPPSSTDTATGPA